MTYHLQPGYTKGQLTVVELSHKDSRGKRVWKLQCFCGNFTELTTDNIKNKNGTQSCGHCSWHIRKKEEYTTWASMLQRCDDKGCKDYPNYGGRGITYDPRWRVFVNFYKDMGDCGFDFVTGERLSLDRKENDGPYNKDNCRWATRSEQQLNKRK